MGIWINKSDHELSNRNVNYLLLRMHVCMKLLTKVTTSLSPGRELYKSSIESHYMIVKGE